MIRIYKNKFREINSIDPFQFAYLCRIARTAKEEEANIKRGVSQCIRANNERMADICCSIGNSNFKENIDTCFALVSNTIFVSIALIDIFCTCKCTTIILKIVKTRHNSYIRDIYLAVLKTLKNHVEIINILGKKRFYSRNCTSILSEIIPSKIISLRPDAS